MFCFEKEEICFMFKNGELVMSLLLIAQVIIAATRICNN